MFHFRNKKNNFQICNLILRPVNYPDKHLVHAVVWMFIFCVSLLPVPKVGLWFAILAFSGHFMVTCF